MQAVFATIGGGIGYFVGGLDGLFWALVIFMAVDYISGVACGALDKELSSKTGFRGICMKVMILAMVGIANTLDTAILGNGSVCRTAVIFFYLSNEGISILENSAHLGLPVPKKIKDVLEQLRNKSDGNNDDGEQKPEDKEHE